MIRSMIQKCIKYQDKPASELARSVRPTRPLSTFSYMFISQCYNYLINVNKICRLFTVLCFLFLIILGVSVTCTSCSVYKSINTKSNINNMKYVLLSLLIFYMVSISISAYNLKLKASYPTTLLTGVGRSCQCCR